MAPGVLNGSGEGQAGFRPDHTAQRREIIEVSPIAKTLAFSGIMFINGNPIPPRAWQAMDNELLNPRADVPVTIARRKLDLASLKAPGDLSPLKSISRIALHEHLNRQPSHAAYFCPQDTVSAPTATTASYEVV